MDPISLTIEGAILAPEIIEGSIIAETAISAFLSSLWGTTEGAAIGTSLLESASIATVGESVVLGSSEVALSTLPTVVETGIAAESTLTAGGGLSINQALFGTSAASAAISGGSDMIPALTSGGVQLISSGTSGTTFSEIFQAAMHEAQPTLPAVQTIESLPGIAQTAASQLEANIAPSIESMGSVGNTRSVLTNAVTNFYESQYMPSLTTKNVLIGGLAGDYGYELMRSGGDNKSAIENVFKDAGKGLGIVASAGIQPLALGAMSGIDELFKDNLPLIIAVTAGYMLINAN